MHLSAFLFSLLAVLITRRLDPRLARLPTIALTALLLFPLLGVLPKWEVLPATPALGTAVGPTGWPILQAVWLGGVGLSLVRLAGQALAIRRLRQRSRRLTVAADGVEIRLSRGIHGPLVTGFRQPLILVPESWQDWPPATRETVLRHERAHLRRRDPACRWIAELACALHWFNPLVWRLAGRQRLLAEIACDAEVLRSGIDPKGYATLLCDLAERGPRLSLAPAMAGRASLESRVRQILKTSEPASLRLPVLLTGGMVAAALLLALLRPSAASLPDTEVALRLMARPFPTDQAD